MTKTSTRPSYRPAKVDVYHYRGFEILKSQAEHDSMRWFAHRVGADQPVGRYFATIGAVARAIDAYHNRSLIGIDFGAIEARVAAAEAAASAKEKLREVAVVCGVPGHLHGRLMHQMLGRLERESSPIFLVDVEGRSNPQLIMGHPDQAPPLLIPPPGMQHITDADADVKELKARLLRKEPLIQIPPSSPDGKTCLGPDFFKTNTGRHKVTGPDSNLADQ